MPGGLFGLQRMCSKAVCKSTCVCTCTGVAQRELYGCTSCLLKFYELTSLFNVLDQGFCASLKGSQNQENYGNKFFNFTVNAQSVTFSCNAS